MPMTPTPRGFPTFTMGQDPPAGADQQRALAQFLDAVAVKSDRGPRASRPPASANNARTIYIAVD